MRVVKAEEWNGTREELQARIQAFALEKAAHRHTVNVPAPIEEPLVETLVATRAEFVLESELPEPIEEIELPDLESDRLRAQRWLLDQLLAERVQALGQDAPDFARRAAGALKF